MYPCSDLLCLLFTCVIPLAASRHVVGSWSMLGRWYASLCGLGTAARWSVYWAMYRVVDIVIDVNLISELTACRHVIQNTPLVQQHIRSLHSAMACHTTNNSKHTTDTRTKGRVIGHSYSGDLAEE